VTSWNGLDIVRARVGLSRHGGGPLSRTPPTPRPSAHLAACTEVRGRPASARLQRRSRRARRHPRRLRLPGASASSMCSTPPGRSRRLNRARALVDEADAPLRTPRRAAGISRPADDTIAARAYLRRLRRRAPLRQRCPARGHAATGRAHRRRRSAGLAWTRPPKSLSHRLLSTGPAWAPQASPTPRIQLLGPYYEVVIAGDPADSPDYPRARSRLADKLSPVVGRHRPASRPPSAPRPRSSPPCPPSAEQRRPRRQRPPPTSVFAARASSRPPTPQRLSKSQLLAGWLH
jgi:hypothetical protein